MALVLLTALNFVNYIDRYILPGVQELVKKQFQVSDSAIGSITFWFFLTYMLSAPLTGWLGDHVPRKPLIVSMPSTRCSSGTRFSASARRRWASMRLRCWRTSTPKNSAIAS